MNDQTAGADKVAESFYAAHQKIYPREVLGRYSRLRHLATLVLLGIYYLVPWLQWEGRQAVLFDLPARKFYIFGITFWPQDFVFMAWLLIMAALSLFFFTALLGRIWCGYACPQTIWTEAFLFMERLTEGSHIKRRKLDRGPWTGEKILRKGTKQFLWITFALWTGLTFVGYFAPIRELGGEIASLSLGAWPTFWILFYGFATYGNAGLLREQVCKYMCPYARFQSAMFDKDTLIISYDRERGEERGGRKRGVEPKSVGLGDCIDCNMCVQVCPTGIDIRDGLQYECIACGACVDVCNNVMDKMGYERGLVRYTTHNVMEEKQEIKVLRPRVFVYATLLTALFAGFIFAIAGRSPLLVDVIRDRNSLYRQVSGSLVENVYSLKLVNRTDARTEFDISVAGMPGIQVIVGQGQGTVAASPEEVVRVPVRVQVPTDEIKRVNNVITFTVATRGDRPVSVDHDSTFLGPVSGLGTP